MKILKQLAFIMFLNFVGDFLSYILKIPIPGSIIGMVILLFLLKFKIIKEDQIKEITDFFLTNITFFFIPVGVGVLAVYKYLREYLWQALIIIFVSTLLTMIISSLVSEFLVSRKDKTQ